MVTLTNSTVSGNAASGGRGGGIYSSGTLTLTNSTVSGNAANFGGGIFISGGTTTLTTVTVSGNTTNGSGGGIYNNGGTTTLANSTVSGNSTANNVGGISNFGTVNATGSIVAGNTAPDVGGFGFTADATNVTSVDAPTLKLAPLGNYGGPTQTQPPLPGSPALDKYAAASGACNGQSTDQRGLSRPLMGTNCDAGAVESRGFVFSLPGGGNQRTGVGTAFPTALTVTVTGNTVTGSIREPVDGGIVAFTGPMAGASIAPNPTTATIPTTGAISDGIASAAVTANGTAGGPYTVTASAGGATGGATYSLTNAPIVASVSPSSGDVNGGNLVTITGAGFVPGTMVTIGGTTVAPDTITATTLTFRTPAHAAGTVDMIVTVSGIGTTKTGAYTYGVVNPLPPPQPSVPANGIPNPRPAPQPSAPVIGTPAPLPPSR